MIRFYLANEGQKKIIDAIIIDEETCEGLCKSSMLVTYAGLPITVAFLGQLLMEVVNLAMLSVNKDNNEISAASTGVQLYFLLIVSSSIGLTDGAYSLCSQAFGKKDYELVGFHLNQGIVIVSHGFSSSLPFLTYLCTMDMIKMQDINYNFTFSLRFPTCFSSTNKSSSGNSSKHCLSSISRAFSILSPLHSILPHPITL